MTEKELKSGQQLLNTINQNNKQTVCIFTYATGKKIHTKQWWKQFYIDLKHQFKDHNILEILPLENVSQMVGGAVSQGDFKVYKRMIPGLRFVLKGFL